MKQVLVFGAGRSASSLIHYLLEKAAVYDWHITVADASAEAAQSKVGGNKRGTAVGLDALDASARGQLIQKADVVVSLLPPNLHHFVAEDCIKYSKSLATASYVSAEVQALDAAAKEKGLLFLCELGLDPGIDHMSAMQLIDQIKTRGGKITAFKSGAGGLVAPESDDNPWHYKFSWAPRNVVLAGQGIAKYMKNGQYKHLPYHRLFAEVEELEIQGMGVYEAYPNRISLKYESAYGLKGVPTILRQTIRHKGYCKAWNLLVQLGMTDDSYKMDYSEYLTYASLTRSFLPAAHDELSFPDLRARVAHFFGLPYEDEALEMLEWLDLFEEIPINFDEASPAEILQFILEHKWKLHPNDKDMIIMQHQVDYTLSDGSEHQHFSTMVYKGDNANNTAMSKLVGLPLAMGVKNILLGNYQKISGVHIPILPEIYEPIMNELIEWGVRFDEKEN
jgi:saccharopine dehydrogenase (NADP+, L-glutamate forming)